MPPTLNDKGFNANQWIIKGLEALAFLFLANFYYTTQENNKSSEAANKEVLKMLGDLKEDKAAQTQLNIYMKEGLQDLKEKNKQLEKDLRTLEREVTLRHN